MAIWTVHGLIPIVITFTAMNLGINIVWALSYDQILAEAPPERAGTASGAAETSNELSAALGVALPGSLGAAVYTASVTGSLPVGLPQQDADIAADSLSGAAALAERLPADTADQVLDVARNAFTGGMQAASALLALLLALVAIAVAVLLRDRGTRGGGWVVP